MNNRSAGVALLLAGVLALPACSINVRDDYAGARETSCSVSCPGKGRASVSCAASETPACSCAPSPASACVTREHSAGAERRHSAVVPTGVGGAIPL